MKRNQALKSYTVTLFNDSEYNKVINTTSPGKARYDYYMDTRDCYDWSFFEFIKKSKVKCNGLPFTSEEFKKTAEYRGVPFAHCGMKVKVGEETGYIVSNNESANFNVLFLGGKYNNHVLNCHPNSEIEYFNQSGDLIKSFKK